MVQAEVKESQISENPDRFIMLVPGLTAKDSYRLANASARMARSLAPKLTGGGAKNITPLWGAGFFGMMMPDKHMWYQERGTNPFTMTKLAGKVIPMWIDDPTGKERQSNPKAKVRVTASGKTQVLIFRRAAKMGERKEVRRKSRITGQWTTTTVPKHWPGAPGRIAVREAAQSFTTPGRTPGAVARSNVGVWWRHPGITPRGFANHAMTTIAQRRGIIPKAIYLADASWRARI